MRRIMLLLFLGFIIAFPSRGFSINLGDVAPDFTAESMEGRKISYYDDIKGKKPLYLVFWATW